MRGINPDTGNWEGAGPLSADAADAMMRNEDASADAEATYLDQQDAEAQKALDEVIAEVDDLLANLRNRLIIKGMTERGFYWHLR